MDSAEKALDTWQGKNLTKQYLTYPHDYHLKT